MLKKIVLKNHATFSGSFDELNRKLKNSIYLKKKSCVAFCNMFTATFDHFNVFD